MVVVAPYCLPCQLLCPNLYFTEHYTFCTEIRIRYGPVRPTGFLLMIRSGEVRLKISIRLAPSQECVIVWTSVYLPT